MARKRRKIKNSGTVQQKASTTAGTCLSLSAAGSIVQEASNGPHDLDQTLEEVGLISDYQREGFKERVRQGVLSNGCHIDPSDIPSDAEITLREVRDAIQAAAN